MGVNESLTFPTTTGRPPLEEIMASRKAAVSRPSGHELTSA